MVQLERRTAPQPRHSRSPRVFVSYAHDSEEHKEQVRRFSTFLRTEAGIDAHIDVWYEDCRRDWSLWANARLREADFVLVIASPAYRIRADGLARQGEGRGATYEGGWLRDKITMDRSHWIQRILPILLPGHGRDEIPEFLAPYSTTSYEITDFSLDGIASLRAALTGRPRHPLPRLRAFVGPPPAPQPDQHRPLTGTGRHRPGRRRRPSRWLVTAALPVATAAIVALVTAFSANIARQQSQDAPTSAATVTPASTTVTVTTAVTAMSTTVTPIQSRTRVDLVLDMAGDPPQRAFAVSGWQQAPMARADFSVGCVEDVPTKNCKSPLSLRLFAHKDVSQVGRMVEDSHLATNDPRLCDGVTFGDGSVLLEPGERYCVRTNIHVILVSIRAIPKPSAEITVPLDVIAWRRP